MLKCKLFVLIVFGLGLKNCSGQNLALNKTYSLSDQPNYGEVDNEQTKTALTDGRNTFGLFWEQKTTLGWEGLKSVLITIDLAQVANVGTISFNSARRKQAGVYFPSNILIFLSNDNKSFSYVGDATAKGDNIAGDYAVKKFSIENINQPARYVLIKVIASQNNIFCDEIEVIKGKAAQTKVTLIAKEKLETFIQSQLNLETERKQLIARINRLKQQSFGAKTIELLNETQTKIKKPVVSAQVIEQLEQVLQNAVALDLNKKFGSSVIITKLNPWQTVDPYMLPKNNAKMATFTATLPYLGSSYYGVTLTNTAKTVQRITVAINSKQALSLLEAFQVNTINNSNVPDALIPIKETIDLKAGETKLFVLKLTGIIQGVSTSKITFNYNGKEIVVNLALTVTTKKRPEPSLHTINWGYLNQYMIKGRTQEVVSDLESHNVNVVSVPEQYVPTITATDFTMLNQYLSPFKKVKKILIEMNYSQEKYKTTAKLGAFMSGMWQNQFREWYRQIISTLKKQGYNEDQVYLYPYDEVSGKNINGLKSFTQWLHATVKGAKVYATLNDEEAITELVPILDISQLLWTHVDVKKNYQNKQNETWIYDTQGFSRNLNPYSYYRLMAWRAYLYGFSGVGFWNYADIGQDTKNLYFGPCPQRDYAIVYNDLKGNIISSRRWEAFKMGVEEYETIKEYGTVFGVNAAKALVQKVMMNEDKFEMADIVIQEMLNSLKK